MDEAGNWRKYQPLRINKSNKKSYSSHDMTGKDKTKTSRTKSLHDMQKTLVEKARESRVSFSGVSVMVEAALSLSSFALRGQSKEDVDRAVRDNDYQEVRRLIESKKTDLYTALVSTLERVSGDNLDNITNYHQLD